MHERDVERRRGEPAVERVVEEAAHELVGGALLHVERHPRVIGDEMRHEQRQEARREGGDDAEPIGPRELVPGVDEIAEPLALVQHRARLRHDRRAALGGDDGLVRAVEDGDAEDLFELVDLHAQARLRDMAALGGDAEGPMAIHGHDIPELRQRHPGEIQGHRRRMSTHPHAR